MFLNETTKINIKKFALFHENEGQDELLILE